MEDFRLNAAKIISAQKKRNGARSPESDSNWDSSEPEGTLPSVSSGDEVSMVSSRSRGKAKIHKPTAPKQEGHTSRPHMQAHKPVASNRLTVNGELFTNKSSPVSSIRSGNVSKAGVNVFIDRGNIDSSDEDISVASKKSARPKEERPPYDFRKALDEAPRIEDRTSNQPGKSRKGAVYEPSPDRLSLNTRSEKKQTSSGTPDDRKEKKNKWKVNLGFQPDGAPNPEPPNNNNVEQLLQKDLALTTMTARTSDVELRKMEESMMGRGKEADDQGRYDEARYDEARIEESHILVEENTQRYIYHFQHGNMRYYDTRPSRQDVYMTGIANKSERLVRRGVQEVFAALRIIVDFLLILLLELLRFLAYNVFGLLCVGLLTTFGDYFFKPVLAALFNSILQPLTVFLYNIGVALRTIIGPFIDILKAVLTQFAMLLRAFRLIDVNWRTGSRDVNSAVEDV